MCETDSVLVSTAMDRIGDNDSRQIEEAQEQARMIFQSFIMLVLRIFTILMVNATKNVNLNFDLPIHEQLVAWVLRYISDYLIAANTISQFQHIKQTYILQSGRLHADAPQWPKIIQINITSFSSAGLRDKFENIPFKKYPILEHWTQITLFIETKKLLKQPSPFFTSYWYTGAISYL